MVLVMSYTFQQDLDDSMVVLKHRESDSEPWLDWCTVHGELELSQAIAKVQRDPASWKIGYCGSRSRTLDIHTLKWTDDK